MEWFKKQSIWVKILLFLFFYWILIPALVWPYLKNTTLKVVFVAGWAIFLLIGFSVFLPGGSQVPDTEGNPPGLQVAGMDDDGVLDTDEVKLTITVDRATSDVFVDGEEIEQKGLFDSTREYSRTFEAGEHTLIIEAENGGVVETVEYTFEIPQEVKDEMVAKREAEEKQRKEEEAKQAREDQIESQFSAWDGSHTELVRLVKKQMNDPDSFEHVDTRYWDEVDHLIISMEFRGSNAFGGVVKQTVRAKAPIDGSSIEILNIN